MKNIFLLLLLSLFVLFQTACNKNRSPREEGDCILIAGMGIYVIDSVTGKSLIGKNGERYHPDSVRVFAKGYGPDVEGRILPDTVGNYQAGVDYFFTTGGESDCIIERIKFSTNVIVQFNRNTTDTFFIDKQPGHGIAYYLNRKHLLTTSPFERNLYQVFYLKK